MKKATLTILATISIFLLLTSCGGKYSYPNDRKLSDKHGALVDSSANFVPGDWNNARISELNSYFLQTSEPVLYNFYLEREICRIVIAEKEKRTLILSINKEGKNSWITSKRIHNSTSDILKAETDSLITHFAPKFDNYTRDLTKEEIHTFDSIFQTIDPLQITDNLTDKAYDYYYLVETHKSNDYWLSYQPISDQRITPLVKYIKSLTGF